MDNKKIFSLNKDFLKGKVPIGCDYVNSKFETEPIFIKNKFLKPEICDEIFNTLFKKVNEAKKAQIGDKILDESVRKTDRLYLNEKHKEIYLEKREKIIPELEKFFNIKLKENEGIQVLGYGKGGEYRLHSDNCEPIFGNNKFKKWEFNRKNRILTTILFLGESKDSIGKDKNTFVGGTVKFDYIKDQNGKALELKPEKGTFVAFYSNPNFSHTVNPVLDGYRISIVEWHNANLNFEIADINKEEILRKLIIERENLIKNYEELLNLSKKS